MTMIEEISDNIFAIYDKKSYIDIPFYFLKHKVGNILIGVSNNFRDDLLEEIQKLGKVAYVYITHFHPDFPLEACKYKAKLKAKLIVHKRDAKYLNCEVEKIFLKDFKLYEDVEILHTPGHTAGNSVMFYNSGEGVLFSGDCICVDKKGKPLMLKYYIPPQPLSKKEKSLILNKLKNRKWDVMLSHWGQIKTKAHRAFVDRYS